MTADLPSDFWAGWIVVLTLSSLGVLVWLVFSVYFSKTEPKHVSPVWDETLEEGDQPAPMWWFWLIFIAMVLTVIYLMLYPGLGAYRGMLKWSQGGRLQQSMTDYDAQFGELRGRVAAMPFEEMQGNELVMSSAERTFDRVCGICHGHEGAGQANRFPNLIDEDWQWGSSTAQIEQSIRGGRQPVMPGWQEALGDDGVNQVVDYLGVIGSDDATRAAHPGQPKYQQFCLACHGVDGLGNPFLGAPSLADDIWLYGGDVEALTHSVAIGRNGHMPAFGHRLDETQIRMLVAWLSRNQTAPSTP